MIFLEEPLPLRDGMLSLARVFHEVKECHVRQRYVLCPIVICGTLAEEWCVQEV